ncbi:MAG: ATP-binding protein [Chloroflexota bacterium]
MSPPGMSVETIGPLALLFVSLPWMLAGGFYGPLYSGLLAAFSGLLVSFWETHSTYTIFEWMIIGTVIGAMLRQSYRTLSFRALRHPITHALIIPCGYVLLFFASRLLEIRGQLIERLDYVQVQLEMTMLAMALQLFVSGVIAESAALFWPHSWGGQKPWRTSPLENSLQNQITYPVGISFGITLIILSVSIWNRADSAAREMLASRLRGTAQTAAEAIPLFFEAGQNFLMLIASDERLSTTPQAELPNLLAEKIQEVPFFRQLYILDREGNYIAGYPLREIRADNITVGEIQGIGISLQGVPLLTYIVLPVPGETSAQISFMTGVKKADGTYLGALLGRTDLVTNPLTHPFIHNLDSLYDTGGVGFVIDEQSRIIYHPDPSLLMSEYTGETSTTPSLMPDIASDGTRQFVYYQPAVGQPWAIVLSIPGKYTKILAFDIATPLLGWLVFLAAFVFVALYFTGTRATSSLRVLVDETKYVARGHLDRSLVVKGEDEIGQLAKAFEQMRQSLHNQLGELNRLLVVSQGVAANLEVEASLRPVLEAALSVGADSARVVLNPEVLPLNLNKEGQVQLGLGESAERYHVLDKQIFLWLNKQERLVVNSTEKSHIFSKISSTVLPGALLGLSLRNRKTYYGALWIAYKVPHAFSAEETRFLTTLASHATVAVANAQLYQRAEVGRQRLAAILSSTPDPVLVTDEKGCILLLNPAACNVFGTKFGDAEGKPIEQVITSPDILELFHLAVPDRQSVRIQLPDQRHYFISLSGVMSEGKNQGRVCVLRDVTRLMELDKLKSDFLDTVSHDLRTPLRVIKGYSSMIEKVGELNNQQKICLEKILLGAEDMSRLVTNLLDMRRIEAGLGLQFEVVRVAELIEQVVNDLKAEAAQRNIQISKDIPSDVIPVFEADRTFIHRALFNLLDNAIKFSNAGERVTICVESRPSGMLFKVIDNGAGIAPVDQVHIFEKFYRAKRIGEGVVESLGLGLAIVKSVAEWHNGKVWVESELGKGSVFFLEVPFRQGKNGKSTTSAPSYET